MSTGPRQQALERLAIAGVQHGLAFLLRQHVARRWPKGGEAAVLWRAVHGSPAPTGALIDPEFCAGLGDAGGVVGNGREWLRAERHGWLSDGKTAQRRCWPERC